MSYQWKVGEKAACIRDTVHILNDLGFPGFKKGQILTISEVIPHPEYYLFLCFEESGPCHWGHHEGFRPVVVTNIDIFTSMLVPSPKQKVLV